MTGKISRGLMEKIARLCNDRCDGNEMITARLRIDGLVICCTRSSARCEQLVTWDALDQCYEPIGQVQLAVDLVRTKAQKLAGLRSSAD